MDANYKLWFTMEILSDLLIVLFFFFTVALGFYFLPKIPSSSLKLPSMSNQNLFVVCTVFILCILILKFISFISKLRFLKSHQKTLFRMKIMVFILQCLLCMTYALFGALLYKKLFR